MPRYLTKSRYLLGLNCPTKLYYTGKPEYPNANEGNEFLEALAEGGYQVGALAKCYFPHGIEIQERDYDNSVRETFKLMKRPNVAIFEGAYMYENLFIRADIIEKRDKVINLYEVKAKSFGGTDSSEMLTKEGYIDGEWTGYLYDVAYQKYVINKMYPEYEVRAHLMLANKNATATVDGLNQKFQLKKIETERTYVEVVGVTSKSDLGAEILIRVNVDNLVQMIWNDTDSKQKRNLSFEKNVHFLADKYEKNEKIITPINRNCKDCEFQTTSEEQAKGKVSGFRECWKNQLGWNDRNFEEPLIFDLWRYGKKQDLLNDGIYYLKDIPRERLGVIKPEKDGSLSGKERQWLQIEKVKKNDITPYIDVDGLLKVYESFVFPLHFIDFETTMVSISFYKGRKPFEHTAFQFTHHIVTSDSKIEHAGEYICKEKGKFPNFDFVRNLKNELDKDNGTIFRYAMHENTVLNQITAQLNESSILDTPDKDELIDFIKTITKGASHHGERKMVDLKELVVKYYYHPQTKGSNSLKDVLPAVLSSSIYLQEKYSKPIYGKSSLIKSKNYLDGWVWIKKDENGTIINPYKLIPPLYEGMDDSLKQDFQLMGDIREGGAAMTAYGLMQFAHISDVERDIIANGLLRYCELDTLAMVMLYEYWSDLIIRNR